MANIKFIAVSRSLSGILDYVTNREKTVERLISGVNCVAQTAQDEFEAVKKQFRKTDGRSYYHIVQAFAPDDPLDFDTAHEIGLKFAEYFKGYQCVVVTHMNTAHIHNHIIMNSVNFENGQKFHQLMADQLMMNHGNKDDLFDLYDESDGTQRLFDLITAYEVVKDGRVILIDEVDRSFHSKLTEEFVRRYFEITEGSACQMICTTHDLNLMTLNLLRKDEIWFAERDNEHSTRLYSLSEFKTRNDKSVLNDYIQGRYGAIPCISEIESEEA